MQSLELKSRVRGQILLLKEEGYDAERAGWNLAVEHHPKVIVVAASAEDVAASVRYAASEGLPVGVQATGHGPSVPADGAVLVNTQCLLNENWDRNLEVDGVYGPDTEAEIREIQRDTFGEDEDDGIIGRAPGLSSTK